MFRVAAVIVSSDRVGMHHVLGLIDFKLSWFSAERFTAFSRTSCHNLCSEHFHTNILRSPSSSSLQDVYYSHHSGSQCRCKDPGSGISCCRSSWSGGFESSNSRSRPLICNLPFADQLTMDSFCGRMQVTLVIRKHHVVHRGSCKNSCRGVPTLLV